MALYAGQYRDHQQIYQALKSQRSNYENAWRELGESILPQRTRFLVNDTSRGQKKMQKIVDPTATLCTDTLASGFMSGMTNPAHLWFSFAHPDHDLMEFLPVKVWCSVVDEIIADILLKSNFYTVAPGVYADCAIFGTTAVSVLEDMRDIVRFTQFPIGSFCLDIDADQRTDTFAHEFTMSARTAFAKFSEANCSLKLVNMAKSPAEQNSPVEIFQIVKPNPAADPQAVESKYKPWLMCTYETGCTEDKVLAEQGFEEFPIAAPRWALSSRDVYGTGPGWTALPHVKELQMMQRRKSQAVEKMVNPPMMGPTSMLGQRVSTASGEITYVDERQGQGGLKPIFLTDPRVQELNMDIEDRRLGIRRCLFEDLFLMFARSDRREMTAEETLKRHEEKIMVLGPVLGRYDEDWLSVVLDRVFAIALRRGKIPPAPPELQGKDLKIEYKSILHQAQKLQSMAPNLQLLSQVERIALFKPDIIDKFDADQFIDESATILGTRPKVVRSDEAVAQMRAERAKAADQAAKVEQIASAAKAANSLANAPMDGDNALTRLANGAAGRPMPSGNTVGAA